MNTRRGAYALITGGVLWALSMVAYILTHGPGSYDNKQLLFGLSRDNYTLFVTPAALLLAYGLMTLRRRYLPLTGRLFSTAGMAAIALFGIFAAANFFLNASVGVGEHLPDRIQDPVGITVIALVFFSLPLLGVCLALMARELLRARLFVPGAVVLLPLALIALIPWQPVGSFPGVAFGAAWAVVGVLAISSAAQGERISLG